MIAARSSAPTLSTTMAAARLSVARPSLSLQRQSRRRGCCSPRPPRANPRGSATTGPCGPTHAGPLLPRRLRPVRRRGRHLTRSGSHYHNDRFRPRQCGDHRWRHAGRRFHLSPDDVLAGDVAGRARRAGGRAPRDWMRRNFHHVTQCRGPVQEIPVSPPHARVQLDRYVTDSRGRAVARLSGTTHIETVRTARYMKQEGRGVAVGVGRQGGLGPRAGTGLVGTPASGGNGEDERSRRGRRHRQMGARLGAR